MRRSRLSHLAWLVLATPAFAQTPSPVDQIEVTATRVPEKIIDVPASVTVVPGAQLRDRNVTDLAGALALVSGVEAPAGGDAGPASAVPALMGLHEFDAFLLVVDGVPWGGAFNPAIPTLDLTDIQKIEVLKGAAPVDYGATSFVGVIQAVHYPAGQAENRVTLGAGTNGQAIGTLSAALPSIGNYRHSITLEGQSGGYSVNREAYSAGRALYRGALDDVAGGTLSLDLSLDYTRTTPPSPIPRVGTALTPLVPINANLNPADARVDENQYQGVLSYRKATELGQWQTTASWTFSEISDVRGFLRPTLFPVDGQNADSQNQARRTEDGYFDTHFTKKLPAHLTLLYGADMLYGLGKQDSLNGAYDAPLCGCGPIPKTTSLHVDEINSIDDQREFFGQYAQLDWTPTPALDILGGIRLNETHEYLFSRHIDGFNAANDLAQVSTRAVTRPSGTIGVNYALWQNAAGEKLALYADYRDTFKPSAIDFGPDYTPLVLNPETANTVEAGLKAAHLGGFIDFDIDAFRMNFQNLVVQTTDSLGNPILQNAGAQILQGVDASLSTHITPSLLALLTGSYHDAHFTQYIATEGGANVNAAGKALPLSPEFLASAGLLYSPETGLFGSTLVNYVGPRFLDIANTAPVRGYTTLGANLGYRWRGYQLLLSGTNLTNQRPPVTASEFGDQSYYLLDGTSVMLTLAIPI